MAGARPVATSCPKGVLGQLVMATVKAKPTSKSIKNLYAKQSKT